MKRLAPLAWLCALASVPAFAQAEAIFGTGKPYVFTEAELDRRFLKTRLHQELVQGISSPACGSVVGGLLTTLAEVAPTLHERDENFYLDPALVRALDFQMTLPRFPAKAFLAAMVRRVMIEKKMPEAWLERAESLKLPTLDLAKLKYLADGVKPIDSFYLTLPLLKDRYETEVTRANSAAAETAMLEFRDNYFDRDVAWNGLVLTDVGLRKAMEEGEVDANVARMDYVGPPGTKPKEALDAMSLVENKKPPAPIRVTARLAGQQFAQLGRLPKGSRVWIRGRLHDVSRGMSHVELRDAVIFEDRDWNGVALLPPGAVAKCTAAVNDLTGVAARQPGGFGKR